MIQQWKVELATKVAWSLHGKPYIWGGDDPMAGFDCSGFVIEILKSVGVLPRGGDWTADGLWRMFSTRQTMLPSEGCLAFWTSDGTHARHVEYCINDSTTIGASGGGSDTVTIQDAIENNAYIKVRPIHTPGLLGYINPFI